MNSTTLDTISDVNGYTTVFTARMGNLSYKLSIADGSDGSLNSYVWLEAFLILRHSMFKIQLILEIQIINKQAHISMVRQHRKYSFYLTVGAGIGCQKSAGCNVDSDTIFTSSPSFDLGPALEN